MTNYRWYGLYALAKQRYIDPVVAEGGIRKYNRIFKAGFNDLTIELLAFKDGYTVESGGLGKVQHFMRVVSALWNSKTTKTFVWHPWAQDMAEEACANNYLGLVGCGSSGKTDFCAVWAIVNFLCDPIHTLVLVTSTSLKESRLRIWGSICDYWCSVPALPGKLVDSQCMIRCYDGNIAAERAGIHLVAGEKKKEREAVGKLIGAKNDRVIFIADELPELSEALLEAAYGNLNTNPYFQMIGVGNPASLYDPLGSFAKPKDGWASITVDDYKWQTDRGICIHFDALQSPNWMAGQDLYPILKIEKIKEALTHMDENSLSFWRMYRGFWCPTGDEASIYSEVDLVKFGAQEGVTWADEPPTPIGALDPAFTNGGDRPALWLCKYGQDVDGRWILFFDKFVTLQEDVTNKTEPRNFQIARKFMEECVAYGVTPDRAALDETGAGVPFLDIVRHIWSPAVLGVGFGGAASDEPVSAFEEEKTGKDMFVNRVSELWYMGHEFLRNHQLRGISDAMAKEMCARRYKTRKGAMGLKMEVESKEDMKLRTKRSPDIADAGMIALELVRRRLGAIPGGSRAARGYVESGIAPAQEWQAQIRRLGAIVPFSTRGHDKKVLERSYFRRKY